MARCIYLPIFISLFSRRHSLLSSSQPSPAQPRQACSKDHGRILQVIKHRVTI